MARIVGQKKAREIWFLCRQYDAQQALDMGLVNTVVPVDDLEEVTGVELPDEDWDTVGGLVLGLAERIPEVGEEFVYGRLAIQVTKMQGRRVSAVEVSARDQAEVV